MKQYWGKIMNWRIIPVFLSITLFFRKFIPLWRLSRYNHSNADDFWISVSTHFEWEETQSVLKTVEEAWDNACWLWMSWDGCFLSMFLASLSPVVFHEKYYKYSFYIISFAVIISVGLFLYELCVRALGFSVSHFLILYPLVLTVLFNFTPSAKEGLYWWTGAVNYTFFFAVFLFSQAMLIEYMVSGKMRFLISGSLISFLVGLGNLLTALVNPIVVGLEVFVILMVRNKKDWKFLIPVFFAVAGLLFNVFAPGNLVRGGSELFNHSPFHAVMRTIDISTRLTAQFYQKVMFWIVLAVIVTVWDALAKNKIAFRFRYPAVFVIISYLVYCAALTPVFYAGSAVYGRCKNISFFIFIIMVLCDIIYIIGWLEQHFVREKYDKIRHGLLYAGMLAVFWFSTVYTGNFDAAEAKHVLQSQMAQRFHEQIMTRCSQYYDEDVSVVEIRQMEGVPGLFYFDDDSIGDVAYYFGKEEIIIKQ